jgi:hypothetical protein
VSVWVKFHDALRKGSKRAIPKASRFVFLELCIEARPLLGEIDLRTDMDTGDAVHDLIGGDRDENRKAVDDLLRATMVRVERSGDGVRLVIPSWEHWNKADESTERVKRWREKKKRGPVTETEDETLRSVTPTVTETGRGEERRGEEIREEEKREEAPPARQFAKAGHGGKSAEEKAHDIESMLAAIGDEGRRMLAIDPTDLREWVRSKLASIEPPIPAGVCVSPLVRFALDDLRRMLAAMPGAQKVKRLETFERKFGFKVEDDRNDAWRFCKSNGAKGGLAIKPREAKSEAGPSTGGDDFVAHEIAEMAKLEAEQRKRDAQAVEDAKNRISPEEAKKKIAEFMKNFGNGGRAA